MSALAALRPSQDQPARPAPKRTYGRARRDSPPAPDGHDRPNLFTTLATSSASTSTSHFAPRQSPSKTLLDRFTGNSTSWIQSIGSGDRWGAPDDEEKDDRLPEREITRRGKLFSPPRTRDTVPSASQDDDELDAEMVKAELARMRAARRSGHIPSSPPLVFSEPPPPAAVSSTSLVAPSRRLGIFSSASSLTNLPTTSEPPSSPPSGPIAVAARRSSPIDEESHPIRRATGKKKVIDSDEESEDHFATVAAQRQRHYSPAGSPSPQRPSPKRASIGEAEYDSEEELAMPSLVEILGKDATVVHAAPSKALTSDLTSTSTIKPSGQPDELEGMFDDIEALAKKSGGSSKLRALNQKDKKQMHKDMAAAKRDRMAYVVKPDPIRLPMTAYLPNAASVIASSSNTPQTMTAAGPTIPPLIRGSSPPTSAGHSTPADEIKDWRTSSPDVDEAQRDAMTEAFFKNGLSALLNEPTTEEVTKDRRKALEAQKWKWIAEQKARKAAQPSKSETEDFVVSPVKPKAAQAQTVSFKAEPKRRGPDAKAVLNLTASSTSPAMSRNRQAHLRRAGKPSKPTAVRSLPTETYIDYGGKKFDHANSKNANGGATPAGVKKGRDQALPQSLLDRELRERHQDQARAQSKKKEEEWGRTKVLPARQVLDATPLVDMASKTPAAEEDEDEEEEGDDAFVPSKEEDEEDIYSGEDMDDVAEANESDDDGSEGSQADKENATPLVPATESDAEEEARLVFKKPKSKPSGRRIDSDDEGEKTPRPAGRRSSAATPRTPLEAVHAFQQPFRTPTPGTELDLGGFGSGPSPGFSQLFGVTQEGGSDGFAGLRAPPAFGLLPTVAALPGVNISATQAERDNALIAAELEQAHIDELAPKAVPQYINEQGLFTQTKPAMRRPSLTQMSDDEDGSSRRQSVLAGSSMTSLLGEKRDSVNSLDKTPSATVKNTAPSPLFASPSQAVDDFRRLKRRGSPTSTAKSQALQSPRLEDESMPDSPVPAPRDAFARLMERSQLPMNSEKRRPMGNFVDEQAEESDEDAGWLNFGRAAGDDEDEEEDDDEGYLADLVDDQKVDETEREKQDAAAAEKAREIQQADDARRELEAKRITEGYNRKHKNRHGEDLYSGSDEEDEDDEHRRRRRSKKQRKIRHLEVTGEEARFKEVYEQDLESEEDDVMEVEDERVVLEDEGASLSKERRSQVDMFNMLRRRGRLNAERDPEVEDDQLDAEIGFDGASFAPLVRSPTPMGSDGETQGSSLDAVRSLPSARSLPPRASDDTGFSISRGNRSSASLLGPSKSLVRQTDSYAQFVQDESQTTRRAAGAPAGVSVVSSRNGAPMRPPLNPRTKAMSSSQSSTKGQTRQSSSTSSAGSILMSKGGKFA